MVNGTSIEEILNKINQQNSLMEKRIQKLEESSSRFLSAWQTIQTLMGIRLVKQETGGVALIVTKQNNSPGQKKGLIAEMYFKLEKLWKKYGGDIIIVSR